MIPKVKKLVRDLCANYDATGPTGIKDWCWPRDKPCKFFTDGEPERCKYFEEGVLPTELGLQIEYSRYFEAGKASPAQTPVPKPAAVVRLRCKCGKTFIRKSNRQTLCPDCQESRRRQRKREYQRQARQLKMTVDI